MSTQFNGVINIDIRDSSPDWEPFLQPQAPEGAPNVLMIVWDDVGYGAMDVFGGPIETTNMQRIADANAAKAMPVDADKSAGGGILDKLKSGVTNFVRLERDTAMSAGASSSPGRWPRPTTA